MSAHTRASLGKFFRGEAILFKCLVGNHLSPWIRTFLLSLICQTAPMRIHSLAFKMLCHAYDPLVLTSLSITEQFGKNFALKTLWKRDSRLWMRRHSCFPSIDRLKFSISLKPKPPWFFGRQSLFQAIVRDRAPGPLFIGCVRPKPREWVESCYCHSKWRFD